MTGEARAAARAITPRAVGIGLLMVGVIVGMTQTLSIQRSAAEVGGGAPPPAPTYLLFVYVLLAAPLLSRFSRRFALPDKSGLLLIYAMMLVAGPVTHPFAMGFLLPHTVAPHYLNAQEPRWELFQPALPAWLGPSDRSAVVGFFRGTGGAVPWGAWLTPMLAWSSLLIVLFFVMLCVNVLVRQQWIERERLVFPLTALPLTLAEEQESPQSPHAARNTQYAIRNTFHSSLFWFGVALPLLLQAPTALNKYFPFVPPLTLRDVPLLSDPDTLSRPWNGLGQISFHLIFWLVGVVYLLPKEVALSAWVFYVLRLLENVVAVMRGSVEAPSVYTNQFPALFAQGAGAALALTGIMLYTARHHLRRTLRKAFGVGPTIDDSNEFLSYRTAVWGAMLGIAFILAWCCFAGMRLWVAALLLGLMLSYFFIFARIRAETGLGMGVILWPKMLNEMMLTFVGARYLTLSDLTIIHALRWLYFGSATGAVMACQLEGFKIADAGGLRGRGVGWTFALAATVTVPLAFAWTLKTYYAHGFELLPIGQRGFSMVGSQIYWSYQDLLFAHDEATGPQWDGIAAIGAGAVVATALSWLRMRFLWFPLHPIGYLAANSWGMHINWTSFFIGWFIKMLVTRYGGLSVYRRLLPLFLGLIVGDMLHQGVWGMVAWARGGTA